MSEPTRLVTIPFSHFCEKARWALDHHRVPYREEGHPPVFHMLAARRAGGKRTTPVLVENGTVLDDSSLILEHVDRRAEPGRRLYPEDAERAKEVRALEELFDENLGPHTRRLGYFHVLQHPKVVRRTARVGVPWHEQALFRALYPLMTGIMRKGMRIDAAGAERSAAKIETVLAQVETRIGGGARYLVGDAFTAADLTFAALYGPLLLPPEDPSPLPGFDEMPQAIRDVVRPFRERPAGQFALRLYREHRR